MESLRLQLERRKVRRRQWVAPGATSLALLGPPLADRSRRPRLSFSTPIKLKSCTLYRAPPLRPAKVCFAQIPQPAAPLPQIFFGPYE